MWMLSDGMPCSCSCMLLHCHRSMCHLSCRRAMSFMSNLALLNASYTSSPTSKLSILIDGPITAWQSVGCVPNVLCIAFSVCCAIRFTVPLHPACMAAAAWCVRSYISIGTQSAVDIQMAVLSCVVMSASAPLVSTFCFSAGILRKLASTLT